MTFKNEVYDETGNKASNGRLSRARSLKTVHSS
jgi:hypothetical protein